MNALKTMARICAGVSATFGCEELASAASSISSDTASADTIVVFFAVTPAAARFVVVSCVDMSRLVARGSQALCFTCEERASRKKRREKRVAL